MMFPKHVEVSQIRERIVHEHIDQVHEEIVEVPQLHEHIVHRIVEHIAEEIVIVPEIEVAEELVERHVEHLQAIPTCVKVPQMHYGRAEYRSSQGNY